MLRRNILIHVFGISLVLGIAIVEPALNNSALASHFGGTTVPDEEPSEDPEDEPCKKNPACECEGDGNQAGGNGSNGPPSAGSAGKPVSLWSGTEKYNETDVVFSGIYSIRITRSYDSSARYDSQLGYGWSFNHDRRVFEYPDDTVVLRYSCGKQMRFVRTGGAYVTPLDGPQGELIENSDGTFEYEYFDGSRDIFDANGRLVAEINREGHRHEFVYNSSGKLPLTGTSPFGVDPEKPMVVAYMPQLTRIQERTADGQLTGVHVDFFYDDITGRVERLVGHDGREVLYSHDQTPDGLTKGNLVQVQGLETLFFEYKYESPHGNHLLTSIQSGQGSEPVVNTYDAEGRVIQQTHGFRVLDFSYQIPFARTQVTRTISDDQGNELHSAVTTVHFDVDGYVTKHVDPLGNEIRYFYNASKDVDRVEWWDKRTGTLRLDRTVFYSHDAKGQLLSSEITLDSGETITRTWTYDGGWVASEQVVSSADPGQVFRTEFTFIRDSLGVPLRVHETKQIGSGGTARTTTNTYCDAAEVGQPGSDCPFEGLMKSIDGPRTDVADVATITYYADTDISGCGSPDGPCHRKGQLKTTTNALGHTQELLRYNLAGDVLRTRDANGLITDFEYDARRRLTAIKVRGPDPATETDDLITTQVYDTNGNLIQRTAPDGAFVQFTYDAHDRLTEITDNLGNRIVYTLDSEGNRLTEQTFDPTGTLTLTQSRTFDQLNRLASQTTATGETTTFGYDRNGNLVSQQDPIPGRGPTINQYDDLNRLIQTTAPAGSNAQMTYNAAGAITAVTDPNGHTTQYSYNQLGDLLQLDSPDTGITTYTYDETGNRQTQTDARGITANYTYDALNRLTDIVYPDDPALNVASTYDQGVNGIGQLTTMTDGSGSTNWTYDQQGRVISKTQTVGGIGRTIVRNYDTAGRLASIQYPSGQTLTRIYDTADPARVTALLWNGQPVLTDANYAPFGPAEAWNWGNGGTVTREYDLDGRPRDLTGKLNITLEYDAVGNPTAIFPWEPPPTGGGGDSDDGSSPPPSPTTPPLQQYVYDDLDRLAEVQAGDGSLQRRWTYDPTHNRLSEEAPGTFGGTGDPVDQDEPSDPSGGTSGGITPYTYASDSHRLLDVGGITRSYDAAGNTTQIGNQTLIYNATGRLTEVREGALTISTYAYNGRGERVWKFTGGPPKTFVYNQRGQLIGEYSATGFTEYLWLDDLLVGVFTPTGLHRIETDHLGTPRVAKGQYGNTTWRWRIEDNAFGQKPAETSGDGDSPGLELNLRFPGQYFDQETGLHYNYFRDYEPGTGRYMQSDPIGLRGGLSTYSYVGSGPLRWFDPNGLTRIEIDISNGTMLVDPEQDGRVAYQMKITSGRDECINEPKCSDQRNTGPVPQGNFTVNVEDITNPGFIRDIARNFRGDWGDWRVPIAPNTGTDTFGRDGFFLHGGRFPGSAGCIDFGGGIFGNDITDQLLSDLMNDPDGVIPIRVH
ncbi:MAG: RHS repeat-associated core domain-containing protein [Wenzhouxiangellaceae bacterium]